MEAKCNTRYNFHKAADVPSEAMCEAGSALLVGLIRLLSSTCGCLCLLIISCIVLVLYKRQRKRPMTWSCLFEPGGPTHGEGVVMGVSE
jgi:Na+/serine symporter